MSKDILAEICAKKREHVAHQKQKCSEGMLLALTEAVMPARGFLAALQEKRAENVIGLIAEVKKASPSKGLIREDFDPAALAVAYEKAGASCISVLTDEPYFQGNDRFISVVKNAVQLPVLRKDFMVDPYQIVESRAIGADCILLIMAALSDEQAKEIEHAAFERGMDVLIEVHDEVELERAMRLKSRLLGVNNRNLKTLEIDLGNTERLVPLVKEEGYMLVCESGIYAHEDMVRMQRCGVTTFLVGESLMRQNDVEMATKRLLTGNM